MIPVRPDPRFTPWHGMSQVLGHLPQEVSVTRGIVRFFGEGRAQVSIEAS